MNPNATIKGTFLLNVFFKRFHVCIQRVVFVASQILVARSGASRFRLILWLLFFLIRVKIFLLCPGTLDGNTILS